MLCRGWVLFWGWVVVLVGWVVVLLGAGGWSGGRGSAVPAPPWRQGRRRDRPRLPRRGPESPASTPPHGPATNPATPSPATPPPPRHRHPAPKQSQAVASDVDVLYQTRIQKERFQDRPEDYEAARGKYIIDRDIMALMRPHAVVMHPLPRVDEVGGGGFEEGREEQGGRRSGGVGAGRRPGRDWCIFVCCCWIECRGEMRPGTDLELTPAPAAPSAPAPPGRSRPTSTPTRGRPTSGRPKTGSTSAWPSSSSASRTASSAERRALGPEGRP